MITTYGCKKTEIYCAIINSGTLILSLLPSDKTSTPHLHQNAKQPLKSGFFDRNIRCVK